MPHFKYVMVWPPTGPPDRPWCDDGDTEQEAFVRTARSITELYSQGLAPLGIQGRCSELRFFVGHDPGAAAVEVPVFTERPEGFEAARAELPMGVAALPARERQELVLEVVHGAVLRLARARGWDPDRLDAARRHVLDAGFEFRWDGAWKASPDRRHRARARFRLTDSGYGRARIEVVDRGDVVVVESADALAFSTWEGFMRSARTLRWDGSAAVHLIPYSGLSPANENGLVRLERGEQGWTSFVDDGVNAGSRAAERSAHPRTTGEGTRPAVVVRADGPDEPESPTRVVFIGGGPTNDVPEVYLRRLRERLGTLAEEAGQSWWLDAGIKELHVTYYLEPAKPRIRTRLYRNVLSAEIQRNGPGLNYIPEPAAVADRDVENLVAAVRKRTGLGPHPSLPG